MRFIPKVFRTPSQRVSEAYTKILGQIQAAVSICQFLLAEHPLYHDTEGGSRDPSFTLARYWQAIQKIAKM